MKKTFQEYSGKMRAGLKSFPDREIFVFAFFVLLAFVFWYLNSLSKEVDTSIRYPVRYINLPADRMLVEAPPERLVLNVSGPGYAILKVKLSGSRAPVVVDLSKIGYKRLGTGTRLRNYILSDNLSALVEKQLRTEFKVTSIEPDTIFFTFDRIVTRKVPVVADIEVTPARQYMVYGSIRIIPDSIDISGPRPVIDTIEFVKTKKQRYNNLTQTTRRSILLDLGKGYVVESRRVQIEIPIEQFTEATFEVKVKTINVPDSVNLVLFPDRITVKCLVSKSDYKRLDELNLEAFVDISGVDLRQSSKLNVKIGPVPPYITSLKFGPENIDFIIEKRDDL